MSSINFCATVATAALVCVGGMANAALIKFEASGADVNSNGYTISFEAVFDTSAPLVSGGTTITDPSEFGAAALVSFSATETNGSQTFEYGLDKSQGNISVEQVAGLGFNLEQPTWNTLQTTITGAALTINGSNNGPNTFFQFTFNSGLFETIFAPIDPVDNLLFSDADNLLDNVTGNLPITAVNFSQSAAGGTATNGIYNFGSAAGSAPATVALATIGPASTNSSGTILGPVTVSDVTPPNVIPLPAAAWFTLSGLAALGVIGRRRKKDAAA